MYSINEKNSIQLALKQLLDGEIIIYPTDTLYGFGVDATNSLSIRKLNKLKRRNQIYSIIVSSKKMLYNYIEYSDYHLDVINQFLPGPFTLIFKSYKNNLSELVNPKMDTIGIRIPKSKFILEVVNLLGRPIITTSVNIHGDQAMQNIFDIKKTFSEISIFHDSDYTKSSGSTIIDVVDNNINVIRKGDGKIIS